MIGIEKNDSITPETVDVVTFDRFWSSSRYATIVDGFDLKSRVQNAFDEMESYGGFAFFLECSSDGIFLGSMAVFKDPWFRSKGRKNVACFGLVTVRDAQVLCKLLESTIPLIQDKNVAALRGPVNPPRLLLGYGVQESGFDLPMLAGTSFDPPGYAGFYSELEGKGYFVSKDVYYNMTMDNDKAEEYISTLDVDRSLTIINPSFDQLGDLPAKVADLMNRNLGYRPDYQEADASRLAEYAQEFATIPGGASLLSFVVDDDMLVGVLIMMPDWFELGREKAFSSIVLDIAILDAPYQGSRRFLSLAEHCIRTFRALGNIYCEFASISENVRAMLSLVKHDCGCITRSFSVYEMRV
jgi:hypothetical protein